MRAPEDIVQETEHESMDDVKGSVGSLENKLNHSILSVQELWKIDNVSSPTYQREPSRNESIDQENHNPNLDVLPQQLQSALNPQIELT